MVIHPKVRGFICTTAHPVGCAKNVLDQIQHVQAQGVRSDGPRRVLVIGSSTGYGLAARITAAFGYGAATLGVFFEKPGTEKKTGNAGWYNSAAFDRYAKDAGLWSRSINGDAFSNEVRAKAIELAREMGGPIDLVVYSLASPVRRLPDTGELKRSALKPGGGQANVAVLKSVVTQASAAIPVMPLYIAIVYRIMKEKGLHEGTIEQLERTFGEHLYAAHPPPADDSNRLRLDDRELRDDVQQACRALWPTVTSENLFELTDYASYKHDFLSLFGFERDDVDYDAEVDPVTPFDVVDLTGE